MKTILRLRRVLVAAAAAPLFVAGSAEAQGRNAARAAALLSEAPSPRRGCEVSRSPRDLPPLAQLADSAALVAAVADVAREHGAGGGGFMLFSVGFGDGGVPERVQEIEGLRPAGAVGPMAAAIRERLKRQSEKTYLRLRVDFHPGGPQLRVGRSEVCEPSGPREVVIGGYFFQRRDNLQPVRVRVAVTTQGRSGGATLLTRSGEPELDAFVVDELTASRFNPGLVDGIATNMTYETSIRFSASTGRNTPVNSRGGTQ
ncbi:MAG TPA: energy transducer TonB [Longimicrobium sp.]|nr:energy transducer TonB [Longimicrobium sp.]